LEIARSIHDRSIENSCLGGLAGIVAQQGDRNSAIARAVQF
jgi:hypothetical protein